MREHTPNGPADTEPTQARMTLERYNQDRSLVTAEQCAEVAFNLTGDLKAFQDMFDRVDHEIPSRDVSVHDLRELEQLAGEVRRRVAELRALLCPIRE